MDGGSFAALALGAASAIALPSHQVIVLFPGEDYVDHRIPERVTILIVAGAVAFAFRAIGRGWPRAWYRSWAAILGAVGVGFLLFMADFQGGCPNRVASELRCNELVGIGVPLLVFLGAASVLALARRRPSASKGVERPRTV